LVIESPTIVDIDLGGSPSESIQVSGRRPEPHLQCVARCALLAARRGRGCKAMPSRTRAGASEVLSGVHGFVRARAHFSAICGKFFGAAAVPEGARRVPAPVRVQDACT
jgi:hypothetical protein